MDRIAGADVTDAISILWIKPEETLTTGILNPGAEDHGFVADVEVIVPLVTEIKPLVIVTGPVAVTVIWLDNWIRPDETLTTGKLNVGALLHGFVPAVAVTVPLVMVTGPVAVTVICDESETVPELMAVRTPADEVTGPNPAPATELVGLIGIKACMPPDEAENIVWMDDRVTVPLERLVTSPALEVTGANPAAETTERLTAVEPAPPPAVEKTYKPDANAPEVTVTTITPWVPRILTAVDPTAPATIVTDNPPEDVTVAIAEEVPTTFTSGVPLICTRPDETFTTGRLKPGALDQGLVAAVDVTLIWELRDTVPLDRLASTPADDVTGARAAPAIELVGLTAMALICTNPDETETVGILNPGAEDHGFVAAVEVIVPLVTEINPLVTVTGPVAVTVICEESEIVPELIVAKTPADDVTGPNPAPAIELVGLIGMNA